MIVLGKQKNSLKQLAKALEDYPIRLRWGGPKVLDAVNGSAKLLNAIGQLQVMQDAGVLVPEFTTSLKTAQKWFDTDGKMVLGRLNNHTQGRDIVWANQGVIANTARRQWRESDLWTVYIPAISEWRIHILHGSSIARGLKHWSGEGPEPQNHPIVRSRRKGWHIRHDVAPQEAIRIAAKAAVKAVGYDLGAVDLIETANGIMVLEVNSRPAIRDNYTVAAYTKALCKQY